MSEAPRVLIIPAFNEEPRLEAVVVGVVVLLAEQHEAPRGQPFEQGFLVQPGVRAQVPDAAGQEVVLAEGSTPSGARRAAREAQQQEREAGQRSALRTDSGPTEPPEPAWDGSSGRGAAGLQPFGSRKSAKCHMSDRFSSRGSSVV